VVPVDDGESDRGTQAVSEVTEWAERPSKPAALPPLTVAVARARARPSALALQLPLTLRLPVALSGRLALPVAATSGPPA
jgi:hypothetical protein